MFFLMLELPQLFGRLMIVDFRSAIVNRQAVIENHPVSWDDRRELNS
jgi:hypothetical protein